MDKSLELKQGDYIEEVIFSKEDGKEVVKKLYDKIDEYNKLVNNDKSNINIGYSPDFGYYTYSKISKENYQLMKLGKDLDVAFLKLVIYNIEFENAVRNEQWNKKKFVDSFEKIYKDMEYTSCLFYAEYILNKLKKYYKDNVPDYVINYFCDYLLKTTKYEWSYNGVAFCRLKKVTGKEKVRELVKN